MNEHVSRAHPDFGADFRAFDAQLRRAPLLVLANPSSAGDASPAPHQASTAQPTQGEAPGRPSNKALIAHAANRGRVALHDGRIVTLLGIGGTGPTGARRYTTAHVIDDIHRHHRITPAQIAYLIGATP